jgi:nitrile hydratase
MPHDHHDTDHDHHLLPSDPQLMVKSLESILTRKGLVDPAAIDAIIELYSHEIGPRRGAELVAKCWSDPAFKNKLMADTDSVLAALGLSGRQGEHVKIIENTPDTHHMVVCTLCSCYPWPLLGIPPTWYKSDAYRKRAVREPRKVLKEFGVSLLPSQAVKVWDSTSEIRYLVLPMQPEETSSIDPGSLTQWVTRDSMIGTGLPRNPAEAERSS